MAVTGRAGTWKYEDLFELPDDGKRYEIIDGELYEMPSPSLVHQLTIGKLYLLLVPAAEAIGAYVVLAPLDLILAAGADPVQPDLFMLGLEQREMASSRVAGVVPRLVIEVLSPSNAEHDRVVKRALYARAGVPEYWLVNLEAGAIEVLVLEGGEYRRYLQAVGDEPVTSTVLAGLSFPALAAFVA